VAGARGHNQRTPTRQPRATHKGRRGECLWGVGGLAGRLWLVGGRGAEAMMIQPQFISQYRTQEQGHGVEP
jgi:hypothetical protein